MTFELNSRSTSSLGGNPWATYRERSGSMSSDGETPSPWTSHSMTLPSPGESPQFPFGETAAPTNRVATAFPEAYSFPTPPQSLPTPTHRSQPIPPILPHLRSINFASGSPSFQSSVRPSHNVGPRLHPMRTTSLPSLRDSTGRHGLQFDLDPSWSVAALSQSSREWSSEINRPVVFASPLYDIRAPPHLSSSPPASSSVQGQPGTSRSDARSATVNRRQCIPTGGSQASFPEFPFLQQPGGPDPPLRALHWTTQPQHPESQTGYSNRPAPWGARIDVHNTRLPSNPSFFDGEGPSSPAGSPRASSERRSRPGQLGEYKKKGGDE